MNDFNSFWIPSALMGVGIAIDVAIATIVRFRSSSLTFSNWCLPITATHIILPAIGFYAWWFFGALSSYLLFPLGIVASLLVGVFLYEQVCNWSGNEAVVKLPVLFTGEPNTEEGVRGNWVTILAVSVDAAASGPAKASVASTYDWTSLEVAISFLVAGAVVFLIAQVALFIARTLGRICFTNVPYLARWLMVGAWLEVSVIGGFCILSFWLAIHSLNIGIGIGNLWIAIAMSGTIFFITFYRLRKEIYRGVLDDLSNA
jgi:hypothetical protein